MAKPSDWEEACEMVAKEASEAVLEAPAAYRKTMKVKFAEYQNQYTFMKDRTVLELLTHNARKAYEEDLEEYLEPQHHPKELWDAVTQLSPLAPTMPGSNQFRYLLASKEWNLVPLGKVYGIHQLWLIPALGSLPASKLDVKPTQGFAFTKLRCD